MGGTPRACRGASGRRARVGAVAIGSRCPTHAAAAVSRAKSGRARRFRAVRLAHPSLCPERRPGDARPLEASEVAALAVSLSGALISQPPCGTTTELYPTFDGSIGTAWTHPGSMPPLGATECPTRDSPQRTLASAHERERRASARSKHLSVLSLRSGSGARGGLPGVTSSARSAPPEASRRRAEQIHNLSFYSRLDF